MGPQTYTDKPYTSQSPSEPRRRGLLHRGWRKMTWVMIAWSTLVVVGGLALAGHTGQQSSSECSQALGGLTGGSGSVCQQVGSQATADQFGHIMKIGVVGFVILAIIWFMTRPQAQKSA